MSTSTAANDRPATSTSHGRVAPEPAFVTTHWSVVLTAGRSDTTRAQDALGKLCQTYWYPLYAYVRRRGHSPHDSQDLTQEFFARLLERQSLSTANPEKGRFRSFILAAMNNFLATEWAKARAKKRGGGAQVLSLDLAAAEQRLDVEPADPSAPDKFFEKQWALTLLQAVLDRLEAEYQRDNNSGLFAALKQTLTGTRESQPYADLAAKLHLSEGSVKVAVHRLRRRYRELIRAEIAHTLDRPEDIDGEMRHLFRVLTDK